MKIARNVSELARLAENADESMLVAIPSFGGRYLSTVLYQHPEA